jgi:FlaA1/EpsC-like NDP-sugar epimerase
MGSDKKNATIRSGGRKLLNFSVDTVLCIAAYVVTVALSGNLQSFFTMQSLVSLPVCVGAVLAMMFVFDCYSGMWRYSGRVETMHIILAHLVSAIALMILSGVLQGYLKINNELVYTAGFVYDFVVTSAIFALVLRFFPWITRYAARLRKTISPAAREKEHLKRAVIIGGGYTGAYLINRFINNPQLGYDPVAIIDDDEQKHNMTLSGIKVVGGRGMLVETVRKSHADIVIIAVQNIKRSQLKALYEHCRTANVPVKIAPALKDGVANETLKLADIKIEELLGRDEFVVRQELLDVSVKDKRVLITGGAGSIGSELCRQVLRFSCRHLIVFDMHENGLFDLDNELRAKYAGQYTIVVGNIRDAGRLRFVFDKYRPEVVFHAAAYKHVPMMEDNPVEAVKTNVFGTLNLVNQCIESDIDKLVTVSTDKAVNPANVMGATKRLAEMIVQVRGKTSRVKMAAVRFGNVIGSNGSAIPFFLKQISEGGPVTVTHKDIKRYFMTIPEAVSLVLQTGAFAGAGEVFVLDMGEPVRIYDLAEDLIGLLGYKPHEDIEIKIIGLRKGEKLFEELRFDDESVDKTAHEGIFVNRLQEVDGERLVDALKELRRAVGMENDLLTELAIFRAVPSAYRVSGNVSEAEAGEETGEEAEDKLNGN